MSLVAMTINGRIYRLSCEEGEEKRLLQLGADVRTRVDEFTESFGQVGENRLLLLAALRLADELLDARTQLEKHTGESLETLKNLQNSKPAAKGKKRGKLAVASDDGVEASHLVEPSRDAKDIAS